MIFDIIRAILQTPITFGNISDQQMLHQTLRILIEVSWELNLTL
jgi:hypothetical protein